MWSIQLHRFKLLHPTVNKQMHLQENTVFDLDLGVNVTRDVVLFKIATSNGLGVAFT